MKKLQENGNDIIISDAHQKRLKIDDFMSKAMREDYMDASDTSYSPGAYALHKL